MRGSAESLSPMLVDVLYVSYFGAVEILYLN